MCIHTKRELEQTILYFHRKGMENISGVMLRTASGRLIGAWTCLADKPAAVAKSIAEVMHWHTEGGLVVDLSLVNTWRRFHNMAPLDARGLPLVQADEVTDVDGSNIESLRGRVRTWLTRVSEANYATA